MKAITKYVSNDGREFMDEQSCLKHEALKLRIKEIISQLYDIPDNTGFSNGSGYVQQNKYVVEKVKNEIIDLIKENSNDKEYQKTIELHRNSKPRLGWISYCLSDNSPFNNCWHRLMCMDDDFKEWGQPYFAMNPEQGTQIRINKP